MVARPGENSVADFYRVGGYATDSVIVSAVSATRGLLDDDAYVPYAQRVVDRCVELGWSPDASTPAAAG